MANIAHVIVFIVLVAHPLLGAPPKSDTAAASSQTIFQSMDLDQDGVVSAAEHVAASKAVFGGTSNMGLNEAQQRVIMESHDRDRDGTLNEEEMQRFFNSMDTDGDGGINFDEMDSHIQKEKRTRQNV
ncbi:uncharacterized protein LOC143300947 [Babylonia areolata]|uniref:uncharacterized protein LOC143300947 n=1 Tax=Babylonia areolata TaxID=304850 RepID=UPI003FD3248C